MQALPVLVMDYENQSLGCNGFLLQLAGFAVTEITRVADALNWIQQRRHTEQPFALLVASNLPDAEIVRTIRLLKRSALDLPILIANRRIPANRDQLYERSELGSNVFFCRPEQIGPAARHLTNPTTVDLPTAAEKNSRHSTNNRTDS